MSNAAAGGSTDTASDAAPGAATAKAPRPAIAPFGARQAAAHQEAWPKHLDTKAELENSLGMKLRLIPPGEFLMGSPREEIDALVQSTADEGCQQAFRFEGPRHRVQLTKAFYLASCEVTQRQYQAVLGVNPSRHSLSGPGKDAVKALDTGQLPVEMVSFFDVDFCNQLSQREQRSPYYARDGEMVTILGGTGYRLPTEAEWEHACRAETTTRWFFGDDERNLRHHAWLNSNSDNRTHRVGELAANPYGLHDLYGNVCEWCWDWARDYPAGAVSDPTSANGEIGSSRMLRGGRLQRTARTLGQPQRFHSHVSLPLHRVPRRQDLPLS